MNMLFLDWMIQKSAAIKSYFRTFIACL